MTPNPRGVKMASITTTAHDTPECEAEPVKHTYIGCACVCHAHEPEVGA